jgi:hypothetical protein
VLNELSSSVQGCHLLELLLLILLWLYSHTVS